MSASVAGSQSSLSRPLRIPMKRSPCARSRPSSPIPNAGVSASAANPGETVLTSSARSIAGAQQVHPSASAATTPSPGAQARAGRAAPAASSRGRRGCGASVRIAAAPDDRVVRVAGVPEDRRRTRVPVVEVEDVDRAAVGRAAPRGPPGRTGRTARRCRRSRRRRPRRSRLAVERGGVVDEAEPVPVGLDIDHGDLADARRRPGIRHATTDSPVMRPAGGSGTAR